MSSKLRGLRISPDGKFVTSVPVVCERLDGLAVYCVLSDLIQVCDTASGDLIKTLGSHSDDVLDVIFSPDARFMASYAQDKTVRIWDLSASKSQEKREKHDSAVISMFLSANSELISLSGSYNKVYKFWDVKARASLQQELFAHCNGAVQFTADYEFLIESEGNAVAIVEGATGECVRSIKHEYSFNPHTKLLGKSRRSNFDYENGDDTMLRKDIPIVKIWDIYSGEVLHTLYGTREKTIRLKFSPDGRFLALQQSLAHIIEVIEIWDVQSWQLHQKVPEDQETVGCDFIWSPDGTMIGILSEKMCPDERRTIMLVKVWDVKSAESVKLFEQTFIFDQNSHQTMCLPVFLALSEDRKLATSNGSESIIQLWNIKTGQMIGQRQFTSLEQKDRSIKQHVQMSFPEDSQTLMTRHGRLDVRSFDANWDGVGSQDLFVDDGWVFQGPKKIILLPHDYRPTCVLAVDNTLVMGHASGHVTFLALAPQDSTE
ncbi:hypothetical protein N7488_012364 [Penicillium malachiteum]|nr:hypothetical protein N7488_012364 [Penicillium malachiteum]